MVISKEALQVKQKSLHYRNSELLTENAENQGIRDSFFWSYIAASSYKFTVSS